MYTLHFRFRCVHCVNNLNKLNKILFCNSQLFKFGIHVLLLNPFPKKPWFSLVYSTSLLKTLWEKEKLIVMSNFSFSHSVFYLFRELSAVFNKFEVVVCKLFNGRV